MVRNIHNPCRFNFRTINSLQTAYLGKTLHIFAIYIETLQMHPLVLENSIFPYISAIFLNKIFE